MAQIPDHKYDAKKAGKFESNWKTITALAREEGYPQGSFRKWLKRNFKKKVTYTPNDKKYGNYENE